MKLGKDTNIQKHYYNLDPITIPAPVPIQSNLNQASSALQITLQSSGISGFLAFKQSDAKFVNTEY